MTTHFIRLFLVALMLGTPLAPALAVAVDDGVLANSEDEARARHLMKEVRCLVCQNQSIDLSNAGLAKDLRIIIRERVALGESNEDILSYLVDRYGDWILLAPPVKQSTYILWYTPLLLLLIAGLCVIIVIRRRKAVSEPEPLSDAEQAQLDSLTQQQDGL